ncbi:MAG: quinolinate synthase NadA, partial [Eubacteriales bacterium]|nr:quinolinate synthase NadA [Eubacteriales bacterium]
MYTEIKNKITQLKKQKNAVILAHYYVPAEVQEIADYIGDSYYLAKTAKNCEADIIVFCG